MEVITTHTNTDFDGLASMVAAGLLHPEATLVMPGKMNRNVNHFYSLHKDHLEIYRKAPFDMQDIKKLIVVDTWNFDRIGKFKNIIKIPDLEVVVYDHHPLPPGIVLPPGSFSDLLGATATLIVEKIQAEKIQITPLQATLLMMGIYEDTNLLTSGTTTVRDLQAATWLLEQGGSLNTVRTFVEQTLSKEQQDLFMDLMQNMEMLDIYGFKVLIAYAETDKFIGGLALLSANFAKIKENHALFLLARMSNKIYIVGRSETEGINTNKILKELGGGGHFAASSAVVKSKDLMQQVDKLKKSLNKNVTPMLRAMDFMSSPVRTVNQNEKISDADKIMNRYGYNGFPVIDDADKIVGMVSRGDISKAKRHQLEHAPVKGIMNQNIVKVGPQTTISQITSIMMERNIGRLPIVHHNKLLGIISRSDILEHMYTGSLIEEDSMPTQYPYGEKSNIWQQMVKTVSSDVYAVIVKASNLAAKTKDGVFLVGGAVRDLLLGINCHDIDLVVEGDAPQYAQDLADALGGELISHAQFGTSTIDINNENIKLDVAMARKEYYQRPGALPDVEGSSLREDLYRRDFTINAMAVSLNSYNRGNIIDFFAGRKDLKNQKIRVMHSLSFVEDPTRLLRGLRFAGRYDFSLSKRTAILASQAVENEMLDRVTPERLTEEMHKIFIEEKTVKILLELNRINAWEAIFPDITWDEELENKLKKIDKLWYKIFAIDKNSDRSLMFFLALVSKMTVEKCKNFTHHFSLPKHYRLEMLHVIGEKRIEINDARKNWRTPGDMHCILRNISPEGIAALMLDWTDQEIIMGLEYLKLRHKGKLLICGHDLSDLNLPPGPIYREILNAVSKKKIDGEIKTYEEELALVRHIIKEGKML